MQATRFNHESEEKNIQFIMEVYGDSEEKAKRNMRRSDNARSAYYENISGRKWGDSKNYNLCIDSSIGVENCAEIISTYIKAIQ